MPATFSHPLAVVPLHRLCPRYLNLSALAIGSLSPDFGYYVRQFSVAGFAHTIPGTLFVCVPTGLAALVASTSCGDHSVSFSPSRIARR